MSNTTEVPPSSTGSSLSDQSVLAVRSGGDTRSNTLHNVGLILRREYKNRVTQRSYIISTIVMMISIFLGSCVPTAIEFFTTHTNTPSQVAVVNNAGSVAGLDGDPLLHYISNSLNGTTTPPDQTKSQKNSTSHFTLQASAPDDQAKLQNEVKTGKISVLLVLTRTNTQDVKFTYYTALTSSSYDDSDLTQIQTMAGQLSVLDRSSRLGLSAVQTQQLFAATNFQVVHTQADQGPSSLAAYLSGYFIGVVGIVLIFTAVYLYGIWIATGVAEEKGTRVMEILVNAATPFQLLWGKILGIGAAGLTQMICLTVVGYIGLLLQKPLEALLSLGNGSSSILNSIDFLHTSTTLLAFLMIYFILGFLLYATLFAALGSLVKRQDEVQNAIGPVSGLFMIGYMASFIGGSTSTTATWFQVMSLIPFWTPTMMLMRIATSNVPAWQLWLSIGLLLIFIVICGWISSRIYRFSILLYGQKPGLRQLIKLMRA
ncbi:ABC transporter permease [Dictyobacter arantiisoli]|uniref:ABC transporter permease n=1 Tax=Dictyobacter arantiisoli TaxID=2014874 RepID=A0A5A5TEF7_9CHLR|nr:ABC transporter permease [Dictyobacter arantiisoli]GCF09941.1 ABC transporter permease [Dictyobacter arantiisoli]